MTTPFAFADDLGPEKIIHLYDPATGLKAIVVVDNVAAGPAIGGTRMAADVTLEECVRLARAMTLKNAAAGLRHGGAKSVIVGDPRMPAADKERTIRAFAKAIADLRDYIPGPDMGTDETCMAWVHDVTGRSVGLPPELGGIPLDRIGATGFGLAQAIDAARGFCGLELDGARVVVQGYGSVGRHAARFLAARGARLVAVSDSRGALANPDGIDLDALDAAKAAGKGVADCAAGTPLAADDLVAVDCEVWIPAARPDVIHGDNVDRLRARLVAEGANIPATAGAERRLHERGILVLPDFIANAGGVICAAVEYAGGTRADAFAVIEEKIRGNTRAVLEDAAARAVPPRQAADDLAAARVRRAMAYRKTY
ncbi:MAG: Glu/Leu/Phe/Val dehydrogenase [Hyphomicrobiales bacterium]|nr:Glu/Leu/Phe/Val dehydrogenase [Hyphomicrobiales bacterium]MCP5373421.1 Glu/Leu/Phe/Val dehydrogenase [Hyphomicrobiales bacterium]